LDLVKDMQQPTQFCIVQDLELRHREQEHDNLVARFCRELLSSRIPCLDQGSDDDDDDDPRESLHSYLEEREGCEAVEWLSSTTEGEEAWTVLVELVRVRRESTRGR